MPSSASFHNFSLPSFVYRSQSHQNLSSLEQTVSSLYGTAAHAATESVLPYVHEEAASNPSSSSITALPPPSEPALRRKWSFWRNSSEPGTSDKPSVLKKRAPAIITTLVDSPPGTPTTPPTSKVSKTKWALIVSKFKSPFARLKKRTSPKTSQKTKPMLISSPSGFQHLGSGSGMPLRREDAQKTKPMLISSPSGFQHLGSGGVMPLRRGDSLYTFGGQRDKDRDTDGEGGWGQGQEDEWEDMEG